ncbi:ADOP family duplicated permease [Candidatus Zixiibacteriota bacterium]
MRWITKILFRLRTVFNWRRAVDELDEEMDFHIEMATRKYREQGLSEKEARRTAMREFGAIYSQKELVRELWGVGLINRLRTDTLHTFRQLRHSPVFATVAIVTLALGIGANTAIFSLANALLIRDMPFERAEELVDLYTSVPGFESAPLSYPDFRDLQEGTGDVFTGIGGVSMTFGQTEENGRLTSLLVEVVTGNYFPVLGVDAALGRTILSEDDVSRGAHYVVMLGHAYWMQAYGGDPDVIGQSIRINGGSYSIIGVASETYLGSLRGFRPDIIAPMMMFNELQGTPHDQLARRHLQILFGKARLRPGVSMEQMEGTLAGVESYLRSTYPDNWNESRAFQAVPSQNVIINPAVDRMVVPAVFLVIAVVGIVLLIACANLAGLLLARATKRRREVAVRLALGAGRGTLIRQLLTESMVLALMGGIAGLVVGHWMARALSRIEAPSLGVTIGLDLSQDGSVLLLTAVATLVSGIIFGLIPALQATNLDMVSILKNEEIGIGRMRRVTLRKLLVVGQVAASLVLLATASLFLRSLQTQQRIDPGFGYEPTAFVQFSLPSYPGVQEGRAAFNSIREEAAAMPGVQAAGCTEILPLEIVRTSTIDVNVDGVDPPSGYSAHRIDHFMVDAGYFEAIGIPLLRGRNFRSGDTPDSRGVAIIDEVMADRFWPGEDPLDRVIQMQGRGELVVVGVARSAMVRTLGEAPGPAIYRPLSQAYSSVQTLLVQTSGPAEPFLPRIVELVRKTNPEAVFWVSKTMKEHLDTLVLPARLGALFCAAFALVALSLALIGLYAIVHHAVTDRLREMGIRISLGANPMKVVGMLVGGGMKLAITGCVIGLLLTLGVSLALRDLLVGVRVLDPVTFLAVPALLLAVAFLAAWGPARMVSRTDPVRALRTE